jgi:hypothetical protein
MGQLDRDWYKEHHQKRSQKRTLDNDPRETDDFHHKPFKFTFWHLIATSLSFLAYILWHFN